MSNTDLIYPDFQSHVKSTIESAIPSWRRLKRYVTRLLTKRCPLPDSKKECSSGWT